jgi:DNA-binding beta-propeller fold protein YncE
MHQVTSQIVNPIEVSSSVPTLRNIIVSDNNDRHVVGLTLVDSRLFVLRNPNQQLIDTYDTQTFAPLSPLRVDGLGDNELNGMTSCLVSGCLYISDFRQAVVYNVNPSSEKAALKWQVDRGPCGLFVNSACHVLVTCHWANKIQEYTKNGLLVREVSLLIDEVHRPLHAVQYDDDRYIISHRGPVHDVVEVDACGQFLLSYNKKFTSNSFISFFRRGQPQNIAFNKPRHLTIDKDTLCILVADSKNNRIVILNRSFSSALVLNVSVDGGMNDPCAVYLDKSCDRLYVGEYGGKRVLVFDNVANVAAACKGTR